MVLVFVPSWVNTTDSVAARWPAGPTAVTSPSSSSLTVVRMITVATAIAIATEVAVVLVLVLVVVTVGRRPKPKVITREEATAVTGVPLSYPSTMKATTSTTATRQI